MAFDFSELSKISSLLQVQDAGDGLRRVRVEAIQPDPNQPRKTFDEESLTELAQSIQSIGIIQPPVVRSHDDGYLLISGERRWRAACQLGWEKIDVIVRDDLSTRAQLVENIQREALSAWEIYRVIAGELGAGAKQVDLAAAFGKSKAWIAAYAAVAKMPATFVALLRENRVSGITALQSLYRLHEEKPDLARQMVDSPEPITAVMVEQVDTRTPARRRARRVSRNPGAENVDGVSPGSLPTIASIKDGRDISPLRDSSQILNVSERTSIRIRAYYDDASWMVDYMCQRNEADLAVSVRLVAEDGSVCFGRIESLKLQSIDVIV